ncbi:MAG: hypothetical protein CL678_17800 [Bdellovibrionaceae bacterium]|nr:hypothetical protein [Pseudobdellovibrionaceae bacterium]
MNSLLKLKPFLKPHWGKIIGSALLAIPLSALRFSPAPFVKYVVDDVLVDKEHSQLILMPIVIIGIYLLNFVVRFFHYYLIRVVVARVNQNLKNHLFKHLVGLSADHFTEQSTGTLMSRVGSDVQLVDSGISSISALIREPLVFIALLGYTLYVDWKLTLITLTIFPFLAWVFSATGKNLKRYIQNLAEENAKIFSVLQETFTGIRIIQLFRLENYVRDKFEQKSDRFAKIYLKTAVLEEAAHPMVELITSFGIAGVIYYGGSQVIQNSITAGDLLSFFAAFALMMDPIRRTNELNIKINQTSGAVKRIFEVLEWKSKLKEKENPVEVHSFEKGISIQNISFSYPDEPQRLILDQVSFEIPKNKSVALVGASGAGKSSLISLLPRIFDVNSGKIMLDQYDIRDYPLNALRDLISVVSQEIFLFNDTVLENIRCGRLDSTEEEIREAAKKANALPFIEKLPQKFETIIGDRGQKLSGGERQRLSIARAFLRKSPILILDEATSNLDNESERLVQSALENLMENRTSIIIAHRLSTIQNVDQIIVLKEGKKIEEGTHQELINKNGEYAKFQSLGKIL